jgi:hypothetical protein
MLRQAQHERLMLQARFLGWFSVYFCLTTYPMKIAEQFLVILPFAERSRSQLIADVG